MIRSYKIYVCAFVFLLSGKTHPMHDLMQRVKQLSFSNSGPTSRKAMAYDLAMAWEGDRRPKPRDAEELLKECGDGDDAACEELQSRFRILLAAQEKWAEEVGHEIESVARHVEGSERLKAFTKDLDRRAAALNREFGDPKEGFVCFNGDMTAYQRPYGVFAKCSATGFLLISVWTRADYFKNPKRCREILLNQMMALSRDSLRKIPEIKAAKK